MYGYQSRKISPHNSIKTNSTDNNKNSVRRKVHVCNDIKNFEFESHMGIRWEKELWQMMLHSRKITLWRAFKCLWTLEIALKGFTSTCNDEWTFSQNWLQLGTWNNIEKRCQWQSPINQFLLIYCAGKVYSDSSKALTRFCNRESTRVEINFRQKAFKMHLRYVHRKLGSLSMFLINIDWSDKAAPFNFSCRRALSEQLLKGKFRDEMKMYWKMHSSWKKVMNWVKTKKRNRSQRALDKENREEKKLREKKLFDKKNMFSFAAFCTQNLTLWAEHDEKKLKTFLLPTRKKGSDEWWMLYIGKKFVFSFGDEGKTQIVETQDGLKDKAL